MQKRLHVSASLVLVLSALYVLTFSPTHGFNSYADDNDGSSELISHSDAAPSFESVAKLFLFTLVNFENTANRVFFITSVLAALVFAFFSFIVQRKVRGPPVLFYSPTINL